MNSRGAVHRSSDQAVQAPRMRGSTQCANQDWSESHKPRACGGLPDNEMAIGWKIVQAPRMRGSTLAPQEHHQGPHKPRACGGLPIGVSIRNPDGERQQAPRMRGSTSPRYRVRDQDGQATSPAHAGVYPPYEWQPIFPAAESHKPRACGGLPSIRLRGARSRLIYKPRACGGLPTNPVPDA